MANEHGFDPRVHELARELAALKRHVRQVEVASQAAFRSVEEGAIDVYDEDGILRERFGKQLDGTYGRQTIKGVVPPAPTEPDVVVISDGVVAVTWDGRFEEAYDGKGDFRNVQIHLGDSADFATSRNTQEGAIFARRGGTVVVVTESDVDQPQWVRLVATNRAGEAGPPSVATLVDEEDEDGLEEDEELEWWTDTHVVTAVGPQTIPLTYEPEADSEHVYWVPLYQPVSKWTRVGTTVAVPDAEGHLSVGDAIEIKYSHRLNAAGAVSLVGAHGQLHDVSVSASFSNGVTLLRQGVSYQSVALWSLYVVKRDLTTGVLTVDIDNGYYSVGESLPSGYPAPGAGVEANIGRFATSGDTVSETVEIIGVGIYHLNESVVEGTPVDSVLATGDVPLNFPQDGGIVGWTDPANCLWYYGERVAFTDSGADTPMGALREGPPPSGAF